MSERIYDIPRLLALLDIDAKRNGREYESRCPLHNDHNPSFHIQAETGLFHCFSGTTGVITLDGVIQIRDLVGPTPVLTRGGVWVDAEIKCFGSQRLWKIELSRNSLKKTIFSTSDHRWFIHGQKGEVLTKNLRRGRCLESVFVPPKFITPSPEGIRHGIVFGDGYEICSGGTVALHGSKDELLEWFEGFPTSSRSYPRAKDSTEQVPYVAVSRLPRGLKKLPSLDMPDEYLAGFIAGYIATDGHVTKGRTVMLHSAIASDLEYVRTICNKLGILTHGVTCQVRVGFPGMEPSPIYKISFASDHLSSSMILRSVAKSRFISSKQEYGRYRWQIRSVSETDRVEDVYCAVVPGEAAFAIEDNILTGNCWSCNEGGNAITLAAKVLHIDNSAARVWLETNGVVSENNSVVPTSLPITVGGGFLSKQPFRHPDDSFILPSVAKSYLGVRGITEAQINRWQIGYGGMCGDLADRVVFPVHDRQGRMHSYMARTMVGSRPRYMTPRPETNPDRDVIFGERHWPADESACQVVVTEGAINALACERAGAKYIAALGGSNLGLTVYSKLSKFKRVIIASDADGAGERVATALKVLQRWTDVTRVEFPPGTDAADLSTDALRVRLVDAGMDS